MSFFLHYHIISERHVQDLRMAFLSQGAAAVSLLGSPEGKDLDGMMFDRLSLFA
jgi:hypothetical protein